eukprot:TRINITY_DN275_c0_g1_i10.p1 TRINITY_DN275_c0_g1~~TRINITY_DN275_c0_g1_i10.p1  ORF type:complete len:241 (+),score=54.50 TRINITY_DN275_c0_g1_i10:602-1324(+)
MDGDHYWESGSLRGEVGSDIILMGHWNCSGETHLYASHSSVQITLADIGGLRLDMATAYLNDGSSFRDGPLVLLSYSSLYINSTISIDYLLIEGGFVEALANIQVNNFETTGDLAGISSDYNVTITHLTCQVFYFGGSGTFYIQQSYSQPGEIWIYSTTLILGPECVTDVYNRIYLYGGKIINWGKFSYAFDKMNFEDDFQFLNWGYFFVENDGFMYLSERTFFLNLGYFEHCGSQRSFM